MAHLDDLAFFQHLARAGSLTATARELGLSLSAVSKRLKQLEARLGVELAARTTRRLTLTAEGERYLARGALILDELDELENSLGEGVDQALSGRLRVNATFGFGSSCFLARKCSRTSSSLIFFLSASSKMTEVLFPDLRGPK